MEQQLVKAQNGLILVGETWLTPSQASLVKMMDAAAENAKVEPSTNLNLEWKLAFTKYQPEAIEWAFREHMRSCKFYPAIADIQTLITLWVTTQRHDRQAQELIENRERREAGETVGTGDVLKQFAEIVRTKAMPLPDPTYRTQLRQKLAEIMQRRAQRANQQQVEG